jgi:hypothetical protein
MKKAEAEDYKDQPSGILENTTPLFEELNV